MKSLALMGKITGIQNVDDANVDLTFEVWIFQDDIGTYHSECTVNFDSAASTTVINSKIVSRIVEYAIDQGYSAIGRKDVLIPGWYRG